MTLALENVSYSYKTKYQTVQAVKDASCRFEQGNFYAIVGKSGSGKSTLLSLAAGLEAPGSGKVTADAEKICAVLKHEGRKGVRNGDVFDCRNL